MPDKEKESSKGNLEEVEGKPGLFTYEGEAADHREEIKEAIAEEIRSS